MVDYVTFADFINHQNTRHISPCLNFTVYMYWRYVRCHLDSVRNALLSCSSTTSKSTLMWIWQQKCRNEEASRIVWAGIPPPLLKTFVKAVKWFCRINMSARDPISSRPSTRWQNSTSSLKSSPCLHSVILRKQTNRDKRQPSSCMSKCNSLKAEKRRKHPATDCLPLNYPQLLNDIRIHEDSSTVRCAPLVPNVWLFHMDRGGGGGGGGGVVWGGDWQNPTIGAFFGKGPGETWRCGAVKSLRSVRRALEGGGGGGGGAVWGGDWHKPTLGAAFGNGSVETWRIGSAEGTVSPRGAVPS